MIIVCRYCVLLITGEDQDFVPGNRAFLDFATANTKEVLRFAYVYQRQQQPLCQALLQNQAALSAQVSGRNTWIHMHQDTNSPTCSCIKCMKKIKPSEEKKRIFSHLAYKNIKDNLHPLIFYIQKYTEYDMSRITDMCILRLSLQEQHFITSLPGGDS